MIKVLATGSSGNSYIVSAGRENLLVELGINFKEIKKDLDFNLSNVVGALVTHEHKDHCKGVKEALNNGIDVYMSTGTKEGIGIEHHRIHTVKSKETFRIGNFTILAFNSKHDVNEPLGFLIYHPSIGKILFATDTYYLEYKFNDCDYIMIECNYDEDILHQLPSWRARTIKSHMSMQTCIETLKTWNLSKCKNILLIHLSNDNGDPVKFQKEIQEHTGIETTIAKKGVVI